MQDICSDNEGNRQGRARPNVTLEEKKVISNVIAYFENYSKGEKEEIPRKQVVKNVSEACGVSESTVRRIKKEVKFSEDSTPKQPISSPGRPPVIVSEFFQSVVRQTVHGFYLEKKYPTVAEVLVKLKADFEDFPEMCESTLRKILRQLNFYVRKYNSRAVCFESQRIKDQRTTFLRLTKRYRDMGYSIWYTDETWCGANHALNFGWQEFVGDLKHSVLDFNRGRVQEVNGWKGGLIKPSGAGRRTIILDIGNEEGFLEPRNEISVCFESKKDSSDYHNEMNGEHFMEWFQQVLLRLPEKSAIVLDQAPYHTMQDPQTRNPTMSWKKDDIIHWLIVNHVEPPVEENGYQDLYEELTKTELIELGRCKFKPFKYLLDNLIDISGKDVKLLWLPVAHCELNAIELIWAWVKREVAKNNATFKIRDVVSLCQQKLREVSKDLWFKSVQNAKKKEEEYRRKDGLIEMQPVRTILFLYRVLHVLSIFYLLNKMSSDFVLPRSTK